MNRMITIKRVLLVSIGILILAMATIHVQGGCEVQGGGVPADSAKHIVKGAFR